MTPEIFFRYVGWLLVAAVAFYTLSPIGLRPTTSAPADLERLAAFAAIGASLCLGYRSRRLPVLALLIGIIGLLEFAQNFVPGRHGRLPDALIKSLGALVGAAFGALLARCAGSHEVSHLGRRKR